MVGASGSLSGVHALSGVVVAGCELIIWHFVLFRKFHPASCLCFVLSGWAWWSTSWRYGCVDLVLCVTTVLSHWCV